MRTIPSGKALGATIEGLDLSQPLSDEAFDFAYRALAEHGVLRYPRQSLSAQQLRDFSARCGELEINVANMYQEPGLPEVMILSNIVEDGKPIGLADAGQSWHTDMSYSRIYRVLPTSSTASGFRIATASRSATPSSATSAPPTTACPRTSSAGSRARPCCTTSTSSGR